MRLLERLRLDFFTRKFRGEGDRESELDSECFRLLCEREYDREQVLDRELDRLYELDRDREDELLRFNSFSKKTQELVIYMSTFFRTVVSEVFAAFSSIALVCFFSWDAIVDSYSRHIFCLILFGRF